MRDGRFSVFGHEACLKRHANWSHLNPRPEVVVALAVAAAAALADCTNY